MTFIYKKINSIGAKMIFRILLVIPVSLILALVVFFLAENAPGNRVEDYIELMGTENNAMSINTGESLENIIKKFNLDKPQFYFSITPVNFKFQDKINLDHAGKYNENHDNISQKASNYYDLLPKLKWYGNQNRFHLWFSKAICFDFGISMTDGRKVIEKIIEALPYTLLYALLTYFLTFIIAIPISLGLKYFENKKILDILNISMIALYSIPLFWLCTLAVIFFTTDQVTGLFDIFPYIGVGDIARDTSFWGKWLKAFPHLVLPSLVVALHSGAYLSLLISRSMGKEIDEPYYTALIARGLSRKSILINHVFPNSMLPLITVLVIGLPVSMAGSVIIEVIFNIPGTGRLLYDSLIHYDWNVVFAITMLIGILTYIFYVLGDLIYSLINPKLSLS